MCFDNKMCVFLEWTIYYFTFRRSVRLITGRLDLQEEEQEFAEHKEEVTLIAKL